MRKVTYGAACSLDGYIARQDHAVDWLLWGDEAAAIMADFWKTVDTVLMGRKSFEIAAKQQPADAGAFPGVKGYVCSRTLKSSPDGKTEVVADAVAFLRRLRGEPGRDICVMGGGELAAELLAAGLIDEVGLNVHPVLLGSGVPMFPPMARQVNLERVGCVPFQNGCVVVTYRVKH